jgi:tripartite-type tricarboxylate transporter receptor subunit TctC
MKFHRRQILQLTAGIAGLTAALRIAHTQAAYPTRTVRFIVPFPAGGTNDILARLIGQWLSEQLGQQFIIENRPGAGTNIGTEVAVRAPPDGYTLLLIGPPGAINATLYDKLNFNFIRDITPVASMIRAPLVLEVNPSFPAKTVPEFIAYAKANPDKINMASAGTGSSPHVAGELFKMMTGVRMLHVPYRGEALALTDLIGGQVQVYFGALPATIEYFKSSSLRPIAVTSATRWETLPGVPPIGDSVPGFDAVYWAGVGAPRNTPVEVIDKLNKVINAGLANPKLQARFSELGATVFAGSSTDFGQFIAQETEKWGKVVKFSGAKAE